VLAEDGEGLPRASLKRSLAASALTVWPIVSVTCAEYGNMCASREATYPGVIISDWRFEYLRIPSGPWREPRPEAFHPPIGSSSAA
jgi:hypothetical protein